MEAAKPSGFLNYVWQKPTTSGGAINNTVLISWEPIDEMRTALNEALGPPANGYAAGLAQGQPVLAVHIQELRERVKNNWNVSVAIPRDGHASLAYDTASNRITTAGFLYDAAGNQTQVARVDGSFEKFQYDAANRLRIVRDGNNNQLASYTYGVSNERLIAEEGSSRTYYACDGSAEYVETGASTTPAWSKTYVYLGGRLLSTVTPNGSGGEAVEYHHPDRLGTGIITNSSTGGSSEQVTLPFGTALAAESSGTPSSRRFTSYDRSGTTGLDYAVNHHYDSQQGRFTQVDPAGMKATTLLSPQTLNMYAYCANDPINRTDPDGLGIISFFKKIGRWIKKHWKIILVAVAVAVTILLIPGAQGLFASFFQNVGVIVAGGAAEGGGISTWIKVVLGGAIAAGIAGLGAYLQNRKASSSGQSSLKGRRKDEYKRARDKAKKALNNPECQRFLKEHGINPDDIAKALDKQKAFDGTTSTISIADAGLFVYGEPESTQSVRDFFKERPGLFAATGVTGGERTRYHVYFSADPITASRVLHEALHSATLLDDLDLAIKLGVDTVGASENISAALKAHDCGD